MIIGAICVPVHISGPETYRKKCFLEGIMGSGGLIKKRPVDYNGCCGVNLVSNTAN